MICLGQVPTTLTMVSYQSSSFQATAGTLLLNIAGVARILVENGSKITVALFPKVPEEAVHSFILGSAMGAILHQREMLPLHASGIQIKDKCVLFCGRHRTGKSTLAGSFTQKGYPLHADDLCVINLNHEDLPQVYPAYPQLKLWGEALEKLGHEPTQFTPIASFPEKYAVPIPHFNPLPLPIHQIYILSPHDLPSINMIPITGIRKYKVLKRQTYRRRFPQGLGTASSHFNIATIVAKKIPMYLVKRPLYTYLLSELTETIEKNF